MGIFDYVLLGTFFLSFVASCASLGATTSPPPAPHPDGEEP